MVIMDMTSIVSTTEEKNVGPTGPRTERGKARSSANRAARSHGLTGFALVLPGESVAEYRRNQETWFSTLIPASGAEAQLVNQVADLAWRLDRCARLEHHRHLALLEEEMQRTKQYKSYSLEVRALEVTNALVEHATGASRLNPFPSVYGALEPFLAAAQGTVAIVRDVEALPLDVVDTLDRAVGSLYAMAHQGLATPDDMASVEASARAVQQALSALLADAEASLAELREKIAGQVAIPDDASAKRLSRYRAEMEKSQARILGILDQVRTQRQRAMTAAEDPDAKPVKLTLRVVK
jgi:hypothetical protein